jgi:hypothetical protein
VAEDWPELLSIVKSKVKSERDVVKDAGARLYWWRFIRIRVELYAAIHDLPRVLAISRHGQHGAFAFMPTGMVFSEATIVFPLPTFAAFATLQSQPHDAWMRFLGSSMKDDLRYTPEDCFETFPFPRDFESHPALEAAGEACYTFRADLMVRTGLGLTKTYNRFHDPEERDPDIARLRELHRAMDEAVLAAYGWSDLLPQLEYGFYPDFEPTEDEDGEPIKVRLRYRWPNALREEVLGRLLDLNAQRAAEEEQVRRDREAQGLKPAKGTRKPKHQLSMAAETPLPYLVNSEDME